MIDSQPHGGTVGVLYAADGTSIAALTAVAREFSPRIEVCGPREVVIDLNGLSRLFGDSRSIAAELRRTAADRALRVRVAIAGTRTAARLLAQYRAGVTVIEPGTEAAALAALPLERLALVAADSATGVDVTADTRVMLSHVRRWGIRTLGEFAALPRSAVAARLGQEGVRWQRLASGEDARPIVPAREDERFEQALDLEWPIEGLEPLSFVLGRLMEPLSAHLERRDRGAAVLHVRLHLVTREVHERSLQLPAPMRDARTLRTLALLDLESHPPGAAIDRVVVAIDPTPARVLQFSLITRPLPSPEQISTLLARLNALMGDGRCGVPVEVDSWRPGAFAMKPFAPVEAGAGDTGALRGPVLVEPLVPSSNPTQRDPTQRDPRQAEPTHAGRIQGPGRQTAAVVALRRFRFPVPARVRLEAGAPSSVSTDRRGLSGGRVETCAGPWRTSGDWWRDTPPTLAPRGRVDAIAHASAVTTSSGRRPAGDEEAGTRQAVHPSPPALPALPAWDRDEWDVALTDGATYRLFRERANDAWYIEGVFD